MTHETDPPVFVEGCNCEEKQCSNLILAINKDNLSTHNFHMPMGNLVPIGYFTITEALYLRDELNRHINQVEERYIESLLEDLQREQQKEGKE